MTIEMERMLAREVLVVDAAGIAMAGSQVQVIQGGDDRLRVDLHLDLPVYSPGSRGISTGWAKIMSEAVTDLEGVATLPVPESQERISLRIVGHEHVARLEQKVVFPENGRLRVVVDRGGRLKGKVILKGIVVTEVTLQLAREDGRRVMNPNGGEVKLKDDGSFDIVGLAPGKYRASMGIVNHIETDNGGSSSTHDMPAKPVSFRIADGETRHLLLDLSSCEPATIRGRVLLNGVPSFGVRVVLRGLGDNMLLYGHFTPDTDGRFTASGVMPGEYTLGLVLGRGGKTIYLDSAITVTTGQNADLTFQFQRRKVRVQITDAKDRPMPGIVVAIRPKFFEWYWPSSFECETDEAGWITIDPAPAKRLKLIPRGGGKIDPIELPSDKLEVMLRRKIKVKK